MPRTAARVTTPLLTAVILAGLAGCSGSTAESRGGRGLSREAQDPSEVQEGKGTLPGVGARCQGGACTCRPIDDYGRGLGADTDQEATPPAEGLKRFELRTGRGSDVMRITVEGLGTFEKSGESPEPGCVYVDLPPGAHRVRYHVVARDPGSGIEPRLRISEYGARTGRWYRTFAFRCASGSQSCTRDDARDALNELGKVPRGLHDPCGSTKVQGLRFQSDRQADALLSDLSLQLVLSVYKFAPRFPPDAGSCKGLGPEGQEER